MADITKGTITLSDQEIVELEDYGEGDNIEIKLIGKVGKIKRPVENELKEGEDLRDKQGEEEPVIKQPSFYVIQGIEAEILNKKPDRKRAEHLGLDKSDLHKVQSKRYHGVSEP